MSKFCVAVMLIGLALLPAAAQTVSGTISGTVVDPSSLAVVNATVTLRNEDTGVEQTQTTGTTGDFVFTAVLPGRYTLIAKMTGFKTVEKQNLNITAAEKLSAGHLTLPLGETTESVTVDAAGTPVQVNSNERSGLLTTDQMSTLMARGRDFLSLLRVLPGVVPSASGDVGCYRDPGRLSQRARHAHQLSLRNDRRRHEQRPRQLTNDTHSREYGCRR